MRLLMITQKLDPADPVLGFTLDWVRALAARVDRLHVLCLENRLVNGISVGAQHAAPLQSSIGGEANLHIYSMGKERGYGRGRELLAFYRALWTLAPQVDVIFSHMVPRYALLAWPVAKLYRLPIGLWYVHPAANRELRLAAQLVDWIATADPTSFPLPGKAQALGHGIDAARFCPDDTPKDTPPLIAAVGRLSPAKHFETLLDAAAILRDQYGDPPCQFAVAGAAPPNALPGYRESLLAKRGALGLSPARFQFLGGVQSADVVQLYRRAALAVNLTPRGFFDKAALEAMLIGVPLVGANPAFAALWGEDTSRLQIDSPTDGGGLAQRIADLLRMDQAERGRIGAVLRTRTLAAHSLDGLMDRLVALMESSQRRS
ncbi:MAG: glycosyltransferase family 4 protein [Anaerolineae bacterium]|nr:glycosyltransferase family 4 protein [Anaerolineae bacterium]